MFYVYSLMGCPYSEKAEVLFQKLGLKHNLMRIRNVPSIKNKYKEKHGISTFPHIFYGKPGTKNAILIGGYSEFFDVADLSYQICQKGIDQKIINVVCNSLRK